MLERDKQILEIFETVIPKLSEKDKSYLLGLGDGMTMRIGEEGKQIEKKEDVKYKIETKQPSQINSNKKVQKDFPGQISLSFASESENNS